MNAWDLQIALSPGEDTPVFLRIARAISDDVRAGRLKPGDALPSSRRLAESLGVHRNTVLAAYRELEAEGFTSSLQARGTFISSSLPDPRPRRFGPRAAGPRRAESASVAVAPQRPGFDLGPGAGPGLDGNSLYSPTTLPRGALILAGGMPDLRLVPTAALSRAYRRAVRGREARRLLDYGDPQGHPRLRASLAQMLTTTRGLRATPETVLVTRGSQQALYLLALALIEPGDCVAVEGLGYHPAWQALRMAGARLLPLPVDEHGLSVDALVALCARERVRAVYLTPHHQYPTTATLSAGRRLRLLELARRERIAVIEDDYDHEFHYDGRPILPLASADEASVVVYLGTLSKILAPGLRLGYLHAAPSLVSRIAGLRRYVDRQGDHTLERAVASLLEEGEVQRHARRMRRIYEARRDTLIATLERQLGGLLEFSRPAGGIALWARVDPSIDVDGWTARCLAAGVYFQAGRRFGFDGRARPFVRLGFAASDEKELREAVRRMKDCLG